MTVYSGTDNHNAVVKKARQQPNERQAQAVVYWLRAI